MLRLAVVWLAIPSLAASQTVVEVAKNKYSVEEDVQIGLDAAAQVRQQRPALENDVVEYYVTRLGERLVEQIPEQFVHAEFEYTFEVIDVDNINVFVLPGGPMFLHRGMLEAALTEGGIAGVMAHEISHVALRHGTAQLTLGEKLEWGALAGTRAGTILGGAAGRAVTQGTQFGLDAVFLKYSREFEKQADLLGAQLMAKAGYDPRARATMFEVIESQGGGGMSEWLNSHPNPGNRAGYINAEADMLTIENPVADTSEFERIRALVNRPELPDTERQTYEVAGLYAIDVPQNWIDQSDGESITFAPEGGHLRTRNQSSFSHGVQIGTTDRGEMNLTEVHTAFIQSLTDGNPDLEATSRAQPTYLVGRRAYLINLTNYSAATGRQETVMITTTILPDGRLFYLIDGRLFYLIAVSPKDEYGEYVQTFEEVARSIRLLHR